MSVKPDLSVILPIYNADKYLTAALGSIQSQTYTNFECILCDASTDGSSDFLREFCRQDHRFIHQYNPKSTLAAALKQGVELSKAELIARMDADDISLPHRFELQIDVMTKQKDLILLGSAIQYIDETGIRGKVSIMPRNSDIARALLWGCPFSHPSVIFRKSAVLKAGNYRSWFKGAEDYDLWLRMLPFGKLDNVPTVLLYYRQHKKNSVRLHAQTTLEFSIIAQALHIINSKCGCELSAVNYLCNIDLLLKQLAPLERKHVLARMLSNSSHLTGDAEENAKTALWLAEIQNGTLDSELKKALSIYHMRCAKRYIDQAPNRCLRHLRFACKYDINCVLSMIIKLVRQSFLRIKV